MSASRGYYEACEAQELHRTGAVQPHGAVLVCDSKGTVTHASANLARFTGWEHLRLLGHPIPAELRGLLESAPDVEGERAFGSFEAGAGGGELEVTLTRNAGGEAVLELLPAQGGRVSRSAARFHSRVSDGRELEHRRAELVRHVGEVGGFDRVMYYRFLPGGDGAVLDEYCSDAVGGTYLDLRFPASDIPMTARQLYLRNPWRSIVDANADPVPLVGQDERIADLSYADLRSVAEVHRAYLRNMGVAASVSFPLTNGSELMSLVACHRVEPGPVPLSTLQHLQGCVAAFNLSLRTLLTQERMTLLDRVEREAAEVAALVRDGTDDTDGVWQKLLDWLMRTFEADGVAVCAGDDVAGHGVVPEPETLLALDRWFTDGRDDLVLATDSLARLAPQLPPTEVAGVLAARLGAPLSGADMRVYVCRSEHVHEVAWGGCPDKPEERLRSELPISPRHSFERWVETRLGYCRPWPAHARLKMLRVRSVLREALAA